MHDIILDGLFEKPEAGLTITEESDPRKGVQSAGMDFIDHLDFLQ